MLTCQLVGDHALRAATEALLPLLAVSETWNYTSWVTDYFDPDTRPVRLVLVGARECDHVTAGRSSCLFELRRA